MTMSYIIYHITVTSHESHGVSSNGQLDYCIDRLLILKNKSKDRDSKFLVMFSFSKA